MMLQEIASWVEPITELGGWAVVIFILWWLLRMIESHVNWMREQVEDIQETLQDIEEKLDDE